MNPEHTGSLKLSAGGRHLPWYAQTQIHGEELEKKLREHFTEVTWISAEVKGTRLIVHMKENEDASFSLVDEKEPADLVAQRVDRSYP